MKKQYIGKIAGLIAAAAMLATSQANATLTFVLGGVFNGDTPTSASPWLTVSFANNGANSVNVTLTSSLNVASEFIDAVGFNVNPAISPAGITIVNTTPLDPQVTSVVNGIQNGYNLTGAGALGQGFDIGINWATTSSDGGVHRFNGTDIETFSFTITGLTETDFNYANASGFHIGAHVQGIPVEGGGTTSGAITVVPEPSTVIAGALLLLPFGASAIRILRKNRAA